MSALAALSPLDGRYAPKVDELREFFSEEALLRYRVFVEIEWLKFLTGKKEIGTLRKLNAKEVKFLDGIFRIFPQKMPKGSKKSKPPQIMTSKQ